jgi:glycosyltransferase involved in cell wall biosynthesis
MNVTLMRNSKAENNFSMDLYASCLKAALERANVVMSEITPPYYLGSTYFRRAGRVVNYFNQLVRYPYALSKVIDFDGDEIFHITDHVYSYLLNTLPKKRTVVTCHDVTPLVAARGELGSLKISIKSRSHFKYKIKRISEAAHVVADSENTRKDIVRFGICPAMNISVIYPGLTHPYCPLPNEERAHLRRVNDIENDIVLLHVGSSIFYKNVEMILEALQLLRDAEKGRKFFFYKAGQPFSPAQNELIQRYGLSDRVRYLGSPSTFEEMLKVYNMADVLVFPSLYEGFGWPPLEAMACGVPVVSSSAGSLNEVVGDAALICDPVSSASIASQVMALSENDSLREELIRRGIARAGQFSWDVAAEKMLEVYRKVVSGVSV